MQADNASPFGPGASPGSRQRPKRRARGKDSIYYDRSRDCWTGTLAERLSTRSVRLARMILIQAIRNAMVNDLVPRTRPPYPPESPVGRLGHLIWTRPWPYCMRQAYEQRKHWRLSVDR